MPELPEVEHVVRALRRVVFGRRIVATEIRLPKLIAPTSPSAFNRKIKGSKITGVSRRGKFILIELESGGLPDRPHPSRAARLGTPGRANAPTRTSHRVLVVHLRMT